MGVVIVGVAVVVVVLGVQRAQERLTRQVDKRSTRTARVVSGFVGWARREFGRQMFEKEQIQIKPWRETCDRAGRGRAGIADKEQEGRKKRTKGWWESEVSHSHRRRVPWVPDLGSSCSSGILGVEHPVPSKEEHGRTAAWASSKQEMWIRRVGVGA